MKKIHFITIAFFLLTGLAKAQMTNNAITEHDPAIRAKDSTVKVNIIDPAEQEANGEAPDWPL